MYDNTSYEQSALPLVRTEVFAGESRRLEVLLVGKGFIHLSILHEGKVVRGMRTGVIEGHCVFV
jgi:hypothetical protein